MQNDPNDEKPKLIWDFPTRAFHWALVIAICTSFISVKMSKMDVHFMSGGFILFLLLFRLIWGIIGPETAQFHRFLPTHARLKEWRANLGIGHSPWGALSVYGMLGLIGAQASLGLFADDDIYTTGPLRDMVSGSTASAATSYHSIFSTIILWLIGLHIAAIAFYTLIKRSPLLGTFLKGSTTKTAKGIHPRPWTWIAASIMVAALPVLWIFS